MPFIDRIILHNFKSFKHTTIKFGSGFTCIVGPNGSGKSNICDSLLFALGESSLKRMRAVSTNNFINNSLSTKSSQQNVNRTYVTAHLSKEGLSVMRAIKSNNKIAYYLNNKRMTRQEILDALKLSNSSINYANTITQEEISRIINLNSKERRALIDIASGIKEFDEKRDASLKHLESVEGKISNSHIQLSERSGFLKELIKEKNDAELYLKLRDSIKSVSYTILKRRENAISSEYRNALDKEAEINKDIETLRESVQELDLKITTFSKSRIGISNKLNEGSIELNKTNRELESLNKDLAVIESKIESNLSNNMKLKERLTVIHKERDSTKIKINFDTTNINKLKIELSKLNNRIKSLSSDRDNEYDPSVFEKHESNKKAITANNVLLEKVNDIIERTKLSMRDNETSKKYIEETLSTINIEYERLKCEYTKINLSNIDSDRSKLKEALDGIHSKINKHKKEVNNLDSKIIEIRESIAIYGGDLDRITKVLKNQLSGLFGRVYELCSYDEKYSLAVAASSGSRMNYFVVDNLKTAKNAILILKSKNLGRSSFIPLSDIRVRQNTGKAKPLIEFIKYDEKFSKAISFVFSNTYFVDNIEEAKRYGFGSYRYVTMTGELIDPSGTITGGKLRIRTSITKLHSDLELLNKQRQVQTKEISELEIESEKIRDNIGKAEVNAINAKSVSERLHENILKSESIIQMDKEKIISINSEMSIISTKLKELYNKKKGIMDQSSKFENENQDLYNKISKVIGSTNNTKTETQQKERSQLQSQAEKLNINIASLSKEEEVYTQRLNEFDDEIKALSEEFALLSNDMERMKKEHNSIIIQKKKLGDIINGHDSNSAGLYKKVSEFENKISELSTEKGKLLSILDNNERSIIEIRSMISQTSTRFADIKSELSEYQDLKETEGDIQQLEDNLRENKIQIEKLGNVNLKAPEMYELKSRDVQSAEEKIEILEKEKASILNMITEIESKKLSVFMRIFESVNKNFQYLHSQISDGEAVLVLGNTKNPFISGLSVKLKPKNGKSEMIESKSGGERSLLIILLILAIQMQKPMSFYIFDEIDASLDKQNSKKLSMLLKRLSNKSQFIVVSHNDALISNADTVIGVTKTKGESRVVGVQLLNKNTAKQ